ncbi:ankyrin repeat-containing protein BDA1-like protein [Cinnamomum micranthum f. kanehirae]|uniref:Ankyrin repeat-containing protein BDA1-like protein n=1 Tax=Cinnamomum micranthum f. kanehirae TaxID=337451 RepID=A0A443P0M1_9MAGN|nr:ankyrin repeat-containing protein BDA1-like protein [Cinnamomum micranthum f. kanehirae]
MIPLHLAAIKGRVQVLETLVEAKKMTAFILTKSGEPILHLCANNSKFKALEKLVELVADDNFVNLKDSDDNTILHVLSAKNQSKLIRLLVQNGTVDVNAVNIHGFMPLDVSILRLRGRGEWVTDFILIDAGAKRSVPIFRISQDWMIGSWFNEALLVVATLMVTVAFQAGIHPPGGVWQDTGYHNATLPNAPQSSPPKLVHHYAGQSVRSHVDPKSYDAFSLLNDLTLFSSMFVIALLLKECFVKSTFYKPLAICVTFMSVCTMSTAYVVSLPYISSEVSNWPILSVVIFSSMVLVIICPPNFHVVWYETFGFAPGHRRTTSVQARAVGRP